MIIDLIIYKYNEIKLFFILQNILTHISKIYKDLQ